MPYYQNSVIYKLCHQDDLENKNIYIGSTTNFTRRKHAHKSAHNNENKKEYNYPIYKFIRDNGGWDEWQMIPIEVFPCNDKKELEVKERHHIELLKPKLNNRMPNRTIKEWIEDNKEKLKQYQKKYNEDNKEKIAEKMKEYNKKYREDNKEKKAEKAKEKVICNNCGAEIRRDSLSKHKKSNKCKNYIN